MPEGKVTKKSPNGHEKVVTRPPLSSYISDCKGKKIQAKESEMKNIISRVVIIAVAAIILTSSGYAQSVTSYKAELPFAFSIGKKLYSPGTYFVEVRGSEKKVFVFRDANGGNAYSLITTPGEETSNEKAELVFRRTGSGLAMTSIRTAGLNSSVPVRTKEDVYGKERKIDDTVTVGLAKSR
jgi:hypothetical protein